jgi:metallo-beta-lactamase class B
LVAASIRTLGFDPHDVKFLLNTHAHYDHSGALVALKMLTGAVMVSSNGDRSALEGGFYLGSENDPSLSAPPVKVDRTIADGESIILGGAVVTARLTPGHTRGCTSWSVNSGGREILIFCSASVAANRLVASEKGPVQYAGIVEDYRSTFAKTRGWRPDILLANHPGFFDMAEKRECQRAGEVDAFIDPDAFGELMTRLEAAFEKALTEQAAAAGE